MSRSSYDNTRDRLIERLSHFDFRSYVISSGGVYLDEYGNKRRSRDVMITFTDERLADIPAMPKDFTGSLHVASSADDGKE